MNCPCSAAHIYNVLHVQVASHKGIRSDGAMISNMNSSPLYSYFVCCYGGCYGGSRDHPAIFFHNFLSFLMAWGETHFFYLKWNAFKILISVLWDCSKNECTQCYDLTKFICQCTTDDDFIILCGISNWKENSDKSFLLERHWQLTLNSWL